MELEEVKKLLSAEDIKDIAKECGLRPENVRRYINGVSKRSACVKFVYARARKNKEFQF